MIFGQGACWGFAARWIQVVGVDAISARVNRLMGDGVLCTGFRRKGCNDKHTGVAVGKVCGIEMYHGPLYKGKQSS